MVNRGLDAGGSGSGYVRAVSDAADLSSLSYPRLKARTRGFQLGRPRAFVLAGGLVLFIRSDGPADPSGNIWSIDIDSGEEHLVVRAADLGSNDADLPAAERARRERMREVTEGITAFSVDDDATAIAFVVSGVGFVHDLVTGATQRIPVDEPVVDPRIAPDGSAVSFVVGGSLWLWEREPGDSTARELIPGGQDVTWGLADFIAAEELHRYRGHWWLPGSQTIVVERCDESAVEVAWISDPEHPRNEPRPHRYPFAGTTNATVGLWLVDRTGTKTELALPTDLEYVATVSVSKHGTLVTMLDRAQEVQRTLRLEGDGPAASLVVADERRDAAWVDVLPGVPVMSRSGALLDIVADTATDTYRLASDGKPLGPAGLQVTALLHESDDAFTVLAQPDPRAQAVYRIDRATGAATPLTDERAWTAAVADDTAFVAVTATADSAVTDARLHVGDRVTDIASNAAVPNLAIAPQFETVGERALQTVVLYPHDHRPGTKLPVICSPYGGPGHGRVVYAAGAYATDQWLADQGFAVVIADNRGTPGRGPAWDRAVKHDLAGPVLDDQVDALLALAAVHPDLDLTRVGMRGWSFGGYLSAMAVIDRPDVFHAAVAGAPVADFALYDTAYTERFCGTPQEHPEAYARSNLAERAATLSRPLLILHGLADDNVLVANALGLSSALLAAGKPHALVPLSGVTHMTPQEVVAENLLRLEVDFFTTNLAAR